MERFYRKEMSIYILVAGILKLDNICRVLTGIIRIDSCTEGYEKRLGSLGAKS